MPFLIHRRSCPKAWRVGLQNRLGGFDSHTACQFCATPDPRAEKALLSDLFDNRGENNPCLKRHVPSEIIATLAARKNVVFCVPQHVLQRDLRELPVCL